MSPPKFDVVIPYQFYNLLYAIITILCLLWGMVAAKRVFRMLQVRTAALSDRIIHIRGLGSYLTYFDGATRSHMDAVVHTRQSMPPITMKQLAIPALSHTISLVNDFHNAELHFHTACPAKVILVFEFNSGNFQRLMVQVKNDLAGSLGVSKGRMFNAITGAKESSVVASKNITFPRFQRNECCSFECLCEEVQEGTHKLSFALPSIMVSYIKDKIASARASSTECKVNFAILVVPSASHRTAKAGGQAGNTARQQVYPRNQPNGGKVSSYEGADAESGELGEIADDVSTDDQDAFADAAPSEQTALRATSGTASPGSVHIYKTGRNPLTSTRAGKKGYVNASSNECPSESTQHGAPIPDADAVAVFGAVFVYTMNLQGLVQAEQPQRAPGSALATAAPAELLVLDRAASVFQGQEIFGLAVPPLSPAAAENDGRGAGAKDADADSAGNSNKSSNNGGTVASPPSAPSDAGSSTGDGNVVGAAGCFGGLFQQEDCVVCLTMPKEVLLLPCRYVQAVIMPILNLVQNLINCTVLFTLFV